MQLEQILFSQGFGTRHECRGLIVQGRVTVSGQIQTDPWGDFDPEALIFTVDGKQWPYLSKAVIAMNKPAGYECSRKPVHHPSVLSLLPPPLRNRGVQPVGRLDEDTTGLLILTDDGALLHRLTHPKKHVDKVYYLHFQGMLPSDTEQTFQDGIILEDGTKTRPADLTILSSDKNGGKARLTIREGKYHQVKRMLEACGCRVTYLKRLSMGSLSLDEQLKPGEYRPLTELEIKQLKGES